MSLNTAGRKRLLRSFPKPEAGHSPPSSDCNRRLSPQRTRRSRPGPTAPMQAPTTKLSDRRRRKAPAANQAFESPLMMVTDTAGGCWVERLVWRVDCEPHTGSGRLDDSVKAPLVPKHRVKDADRRARARYGRAQVHPKVRGQVGAILDLIQSVRLRIPANPNLRSLIGCR